MTISNHCSRDLISAIGARVIARKVGMAGAAITIRPAAMATPACDGLALARWASGS